MISKEEIEKFRNEAEKLVCEMFGDKIIYHKAGTPYYNIKENEKEYSIFVCTTVKAKLVWDYKHKCKMTGIDKDFVEKSMLKNKENGGRTLLFTFIQEDRTVLYQWLDILENSQRKKTIPGSGGKQTNIYPVDEMKEL